LEDKYEKVFENVRAERARIERALFWDASVK